MWDAISISKERQTVRVQADLPADLTDKIIAQLLSIRGQAGGASRCPIEHVHLVQPHCGPESGTSRGPQRWHLCRGHDAARSGYSFARQSMPFIANTILWLALELWRRVCSFI